MRKIVRKRNSRYGAYGIVLEGTQILLTLKKSGPYTGLWDLLGGKIEFGETPEEALLRELQEEAALQTEGFKLLTIATYNASYVRDGHQYLFHHIGILYRVFTISPLPQCTPEEEIRWVELAKIDLATLTPFAKVAIHSNL
jgi:8-oxo-dGTP diphosphatase